MDYAQNGPEATWDVTGLTAVEDVAGDAAISIERHTAPATTLPQDYAVHWQKLAARQPPYSGKTADDFGVSSIAAVHPYPGKPSAPASLLYTLRRTRTGDIKDAADAERDEGTLRQPAGARIARTAANRTVIYRAGHDHRRSMPANALRNPSNALKDWQRAIREPARRAFPPVAAGESRATLAKGQQPCANHLLQVRPLTVSTTPRDCPRAWRIPEEDHRRLRFERTKYTHELPSTRAASRCLLENSPTHDNLDDDWPRERSSMRR
jgi:hypothetical protein